MVNCWDTWISEMMGISFYIMGRVFSSDLFSGWVYIISLGFNF